jgi:nitrite reductase/ring-hydroxylating ferredoxin subunit
VRVGSADVLLVRDGERIAACERACPHEQADLVGAASPMAVCSARVISHRSI